MTNEPLRQIIWHKFRNDASSTAPAGGILRITGFVTDDEEPYFTVDQPNTFGSQYNHAVNDDFDVAEDGFGRCTLGVMVPALYDSADGTPAWGELWGPRNGSWKLKKNTGGFRIKSASYVGLAANYRVLVMPEPFVRFRGTTDAASTKPDSDTTVSIFYGNGGSYTDTTVNMANVTNEFGDIASGAIVECDWEGDIEGLKWKFTMAECP